MAYLILYDYGRSQFKVKLAHQPSYNNIFCQVSYLNFEFSSLQCKERERERNRGRIENDCGTRPIETCDESARETERVKEAEK